ncbi:30S ribosomal protein S15 [[Eubacterium] cellulosolvens]
MARIHARRRGKSSSTAPYQVNVPEWVPLQAKEIEDVIVKLGKEGLSTAEIGTRLRDQYGIPSVKLSTGKKITKILAENNIKFTLPEDLANMLRKVSNLDMHLKNNPKDLHNRRAMQLLEEKIRRIVRYYKSIDVLPMDWKYDLANVKLLVE